MPHWAKARALTVGGPPPAAAPAPEAGAVVGRRGDNQRQASGTTGAAPATATQHTAGRRLPVRGVEAGRGRGRTDRRAERHRPDGASRRGAPRRATATEEEARKHWVPYVVGPQLPLLTSGAEAHEFDETCLLNVWLFDVATVEDLVMCWA